MHLCVLLGSFGTPDVDPASFALNRTFVMFFGALNAPSARAFETLKIIQNASVGLAQHRFSRGTSWATRFFLDHEMHRPDHRFLTDF